MMVPASLIIIILIRIMIIPIVFHIVKIYHNLNCDSGLCVCGRIIMINATLIIIITINRSFNIITNTAS